MNQDSDGPLQQHWTLASWSSNMIKMEVSWNRDTSKSSILDWDFPWNKPSFIGCPHWWKPPNHMQTRMPTCHDAHNQAMFRHVPPIWGSWIWTLTCFQHLFSHTLLRLANLAPTTVTLHELLYECNHLKFQFGNHTQMINVWNIYLQNWVIKMGFLCRDSYTSTSRILWEPDKSHLVNFNVMSKSKV